MNYLAHLYLAADQGEPNIGGLLGDFMKGVSKDRFSRAIQIEIQLHMLIDAYTDQHPTTRLAKDLVAEQKKRYMGIVLDVFYDHLLAVKWHNYSDVDLTQFIQRSYQALREQEALLPARLRTILPFMVRDDWLASYKEFTGFKITVRRLATRLSKGTGLIDCIPAVEEHYETLSAQFDEFFPQLIDYVKEQRAVLSNQ